MRATVTVEDAEVVEALGEARPHRDGIFHVSSPAANGRHAELGRFFFNFRNSYVLSFRNDVVGVVYFGFLLRHLVSSGFVAIFNCVIAVPEVELGTLP